MGMTRSFYFIANTGFSRERIREVLSASFTEGASFIGQESAELSRKLEEMRERPDRGDGLEEYINMAIRIGMAGNIEPVVAYREGVRLLPCFDINLCEGYTASSRDNAMLSRTFEAPVLSFSVMDSDILSVSCSDAQKGVEIDCVRANIPGMEEEMCDMEIYRTDFPSFLLEYCSEGERGKLREIWESREYVLAEEKMEDIGRLIGAEFMYGWDDNPEGYEVLEG